MTTARRRGKGFLRHNSDALAIGCVGVAVSIYGIFRIAADDPLTRLPGGRVSISGYVWLLLGAIWIGYCVRRIAFEKKRAAGSRRSSED